MTHRGFILQATYRIRAGMPVIHLYGRLQDGRSFLLRDARRRPYFYVAAEAAPRVKAIAGWDAAPTDLCALSGEPVWRVETVLPADAAAARDALHRAGIDTFEADVRFATRYLIDRGVKGACVIRGQGSSGSGVDLVFDDAEIAPDHDADAVPLIPRVLSFDIETDPRADTLLAISLYGLGSDEVFIVDPAGRSMPDGAIGLPDESRVLDAFCRRVAELDPDVLTGWNVVDFDLTFLAAVAARLRRPLRLGRDDGEMRLRKAEGYFGSGAASIPGRLVLDGIDLLRGAFVRQDDYSLEAVARAVLDEGKALHGAVDDRVGEILANYRNDLPAFARYARTDARLPFQILQKLDLVTLAFARSRLTGMTPDRVAASIASFDFLYLMELRKRGRVAPSVRSSDSRVHVAQAGGHVFEPRVGLHDNVWVFDFRSLYPSLIRTFNIDPLGFVAESANGNGGGNLIVLENGAAFRRDPAILPGMLDELFPRRAAAKRAGDEVASQAIKILMNSFYGVLGTPACRFHNAAIANAITSQGRHLLQWSKTWFEARGFEVLYGDTDSLFVHANTADAAHAAEQAKQLARAVNADLDAYVSERWQVRSALELEFEKLYVRLILPSVRSGTSGARKRYAGLRYGAEEVEFVGMEVVRRDWTELAKQVQRELYRRLFADEPVDDYLRDVVAALRRGELDERLVYRKGLRKSLQEYTSSTPPHVAAARKSPSAPGRIVAYVMTVAGPEPLDARSAELDREHYLERQIRPVAEPILTSLGRDFDRVIGDDRQLGLF
ncbi:MAG: DNA polymerase II [Gammaproteobacteria bacterium]|nr:DNA polymerase II [Gammaproteobacteria bacterium]